MAFTCCRNCQRFVAPSDSACPFCGESILHAPKASKGLRVARSAMLAAAIAAGPACSTSTTPNDAGGSDVSLEDAVSADAVSTDAGPDAGPADAGADAFDAGMPLPPYGIPPMDAGMLDVGADVPPAPLYGAPPPADAGD